MRKTGKRENGIELDQLMTVEEASRRLNITKARCYELIRRQMLPAVALGRQKRISVRRLKRFIREGGKGLS
jgi:excisionase family DNA binding protein